MNLSYSNLIASIPQYPGPIENLKKNHAINFMALLFHAHFLSSTGLNQTGGMTKRNLVIHGDITEKVSHGLPIVDPTDCFREDQTNIHSLYLGTL